MTQREDIREIAEVIVVVRHRAERTAAHDLAAGFSKAFIMGFPLHTVETTELVNAAIAEADVMEGLSR